MSVREKILAVLARGSWVTTGALVSRVCASLGSVKPLLAALEGEGVLISRRFGEAENEKEWRKST
jgi:hypothetical protein